MTEQFIFSPRKFALRSRSFKATCGIVVLGLLFASLTAALAQTNVPSMVLVKGGTLPPSSPLGAVSVQDFYIGKFEVTWKEWREVRDYAVANGYDLENVGRGTASPDIPGPDLDSYPVHTINWYQALKWCNARSEKEGLAPVYKIEGAIFKTGEVVPSVDPTANGYRLPTEAEWEWAATGGILSQGFTYAGGNTLSEVGWYWDNSSNGTKAVGLKSANELGLFDMSGNVVEWCQDVIGNKRAYRGGCWGNYAPYCTPQFRFTTASPLLSFWDLGLRVVRGAVDTVLVKGGTLPPSSPLGAVSVQDFYIGKFEVTWKEWREVRDYAVANGYDLENVGRGTASPSIPGPDLDSYPVHTINWFQALKWCNARSEKEGLSPVYKVNGSTFKTGEVVPSVDPTANGYRLPTEAEWEWAATGGILSQGFAYVGGNDLGNVGWYWDNSSNGTKAVGLKSANELGLFDMSGNVVEWCQDVIGDERAYRGGGWGNYAPYCTPQFRFTTASPLLSFWDLGLRVVRGAVDTDGDGLSDAWEQGVGRFHIIAGNFTWQQAYADAKSRGGHLATFTGATEWNFFKSLPELQPYRSGSSILSPQIWIGGYEAFVAGSWQLRWSTEETWTFSNFAPPEPSAAETSAIAIHPFPTHSAWGTSDSVYWNDDYDYRTFPYVLEFGYPSDPLDPDSDNDGFDDKVESDAGSDPNNAASVPPPIDTDNDGVNDHREALDGTNPHDNVSFNPLSKSLVAYYPFDGNANDESGWAKNGTVYGATKSANLRGEPNKAYRFVDDWIKVPVGGSVFTDDYTISVWAKNEDLAAGSSGQMFLLSGNVGAINLSVIGSQDPLHGSCAAFYMFRPQPWTQVPYGGMFADNPFGIGEWSHVVVRKSSFNFRIYINGRLAAEKTEDVSFPLADSYVEVGNAFRDAPSECFFRGSIDNLRFYTRALEPAEIGDLYRAEFGAAPIISINGSNTLIHELGTSFSDPGATVRDDKDPVGTISGTGIVDTSQAGTYTLTYSATDSDGNPAQSVTRIVYVVSNTNPAADEDGDGVTNYRELGDGTNPLDATSFNPLSKQLVAYYPFNGSASDESGNSNDMLLGDAGLARGRGGVPSTAIEFPGTQSAPQTKNNIGISGNSAFSVSFWVEPKNEPVWPHGVLSGLGGTGDPGQISHFYYKPYSAEANLFVDENGPGASVQSQPTSLLGRWSHLAYTYDPSNRTFAIYRNGVFQTNNYIAYDSVLHNLQDAPAFFGSRSSGMNVAFDDVRIYRRTLLPSEIAQLYSYELGPVPTIYLNGSASLRVELGAAFVDPGAVVIDDEDAERSILGSGSVDTSTVGTYTLTYTATDNDGNEARTVTRVVEVGTDWVYSVNSSNEVTITGYTGPGGNITVPGNLGGHPVKTFGNGQQPVFGWWNNSVTNVVLPSSVTSIGVGAFLHSHALAEVTLGGGIQSIGGYAFANCSALTSLEWPTGVTAIPDSVFYYSGLTQFTIPATVTSIGSSAFAGCSNLASLSIPDGVTSIGSYAFGGTGLTSIVLPGSIEYIGDNNNWWGGGWWNAQAVYGLSDCSSLTSITISEGTKGINAGAFANLRYLTNIVIAGSVTSIGDGAFYGAGSNSTWWGGGSVCTLSILPTTDAPYSYINIGNSAFASSAITEATISRNSINFGNSAFSSSSRLTALTVPSTSSVDFGESSFALCYSLTTIGTPAYVYRVGNRAFENSGLTSVVLPGISTIGEYAFSGAVYLSRVEIGSGSSYWGNMVSIGANAFANCASLSEVVFPTNGVPGISVGSFAFANCTSLTNVVFPDRPDGWGSWQWWYGSYPYINTQAFDGCTNLASVTIGSSVVSIASNVFSNCPNLTTATLSMDYNDGFRDVTSLSNLNVLRGSINYYAFNGCSNLSSVTLAEGVTSISGQAFGDCPKLTSITIPASVTYIWENPFQGSTNLVSINVAAGNPNYFDDGGVLYSGTPQSPGAVITYPASKLGKSLNLPPGVNTVSSGAFDSAKYLEEVTFPSSMTSIGYRAFASSSVVGLYFEGDAPWNSWSAFDGMLPAATVYCYAASNGFTLPTWNGLPVVVMNNGTTSVRSWLQSAGFDPGTSLTADPGQRGVPLLQAYAFNMDPHSMQNTQAPRPQMVGQTMSMRFYASSPGVNYVVETSDDLRSWSTNNVTVSPLDDTGHATATMPMNSGRRFMRIKLTGPQ